MGLADQNYHRLHRYGGSGFFSQVTPMVTALLILNLSIFFLDLLLEEVKGDKILRNFGVFTIQSAVHEFKLWEFITFQFLHGSLGHVLFNCIGLFFFGPWLERWWGTWRFLIFYLCCGVAGATFFTLLVELGGLPGIGINSGLVGASAGIYGILIGVAVIAPNLRVALLFPPIELSMRQMAMALMAISIGSIVLSLGGNEGGEAGHLGGAILGYLLMKMPHLLGKTDGPPFFRNPPDTPRPQRAPKLRPRTTVDLTRDSEVDQILDKVSREGIHSLTEAEREFLKNSSNPK
jgi:membrane associated rhomboid family serine protease